MSTSSYKHRKDTRAHIPSIEEEGYEQSNPKVAEGKKQLEVPINPVVERGQDPELFWLNKYGPNDQEDKLNVDIRSLYRHEHIAPEKLIAGLFQSRLENPDPAQEDLFSVNELFGNALENDELEKVSGYYHHQDGWTNRLIQGDSLLVMSSLLEREGMAGQVQCIYIDPPYGIKYGSNWQNKLNNRDVKDGNDEHLTGEPEQIKAFRDTWELGIHSYLSYLRDRLIVARELLTESGSCFVQISDENVHLVRCLMDEVFGSENFVSQIAFKKTSSSGERFLDTINDYIIWYSKNINGLKYRQLYIQSGLDTYAFNCVETSDGNWHRLTNEEKNRYEIGHGRLFRTSNFTSQSGGESTGFEVDLNGKKYKPSKNTFWKTNALGVKNLLKKNRLLPIGNTLTYKRYLDDFPVRAYTSWWDDTVQSTFAIEKNYVVQTYSKVIQRCILMSTDPGDLVLDPTCGSGTTAFVAEQWGRRWITTDTSRIALNIAKTRLMTATYPYYYLHSLVEVQRLEKDGKIVKTVAQKVGSEKQSDIRQGFVYEEVPHITLKSLANDEPPESETLYDKPLEDKKRLRVSGPFTVETLQSFEPVSPDSLDEPIRSDDELASFEKSVLDRLVSSGINNGDKKEHAKFIRVEKLQHPLLHAEGFYQSAAGERKAYIHIGPKFGTVSKQAVNEAIKETRVRGGADWLIVFGFNFESNISNAQETTSLGSFSVTKVRMHDDLLQEGLLKKPNKSSGSFVSIGEPDVEVNSFEFLVFSFELNDQKEIYLGNIETFKELSGLGSLAEINGLGETDLLLYAILSQGGTVWHYLTDTEGWNLHTGQSGRGSVKTRSEGIPSIYWDRPRFTGGSRDFYSSFREFGVSGSADIRAIVEQLRRDTKVVSRIKEVSAKFGLAIPAKNQKLKTKNLTQIEIRGLDIYDPVKDEVKARNVEDLNYWMVDDDYDGSNFIVKQVFFCGGDRDEFAKWKKGLSDAAKTATRRNAEKTLKIEIDEEAFDRLYGFKSHPIAYRKGKKIAVRVVSQFGEESTKVVEV